MRIKNSALLLSLCLCACAPESSPSSVPSSEPEVTSGLEVQFDDPEEAPEITAELSGTALPWEMRPEHWNGASMCGTDLATITVKFPEGARPEKVIAMAEARDTLGMPVGEGGEMLTLETDLAADGTLTFTLPEFENDPSCTAVLLNVYWGENNAWYALAVQTGAEAPGPDQTLPMLTPGV